MMLEIYRADYYLKLQATFVNVLGKMWGSGNLSDTPENYREIGSNLASCN